MDAERQIAVSWLKKRIRKMQEAQAGMVDETTGAPYKRYKYRWKMLMQDIVNLKGCVDCLEAEDKQ